jgi:hypothetical protein
LFILILVEECNYTESIIRFSHQIGDYALVGSSRVYLAELLLFVDFGTDTILELIGQCLFVSGTQLFRVTPNYLNS